MCSIHAVVYIQHTCCMHTNCIHFFICLYGKRMVLNQFCVRACMQYGCIVCAARVQHTCVTCTDVHVCSMYAAYMPNMCSKVADILYAVCMQYVCSIVHSAYLMYLYVACFKYAAHVKTSY